jgi:hypothetical protein
MDGPIISVSQGSFEHLIVPAHKHVLSPVLVNQRRLPQRCMTLDDVGMVQAKHRVSLVEPKHPIDFFSFFLFNEASIVREYRERKAYVLTPWLEELADHVA